MGVRRTFNVAFLAAAIINLVLAAVFLWLRRHEDRAWFGIAASIANITASLCLIISLITRGRW